MSRNTFSSHRSFTFTLFVIFACAFIVYSHPAHSDNLSSDLTSRNLVGTVNRVGAADNLQNIPFYKQTYAQSRNYGSSPLPHFESNLKQINTLLNLTAQNAGADSPVFSGSRKSVFDNAVNSAACTRTPISLGATINGVLQNTDCLGSTNRFHDEYEFSGTAGQTIRITMQSNAFNTLINLFPPTGTPSGQFGIGYIDRAAGNTTVMELILPASGNYVIFASSFQQGNISGSYSITLESYSCPTTQIGPGNHQFSLSTSDCYNKSFYYDAFAFNGIAGQQVTITMSSSVFDTYLELRNSANQLLIEDDNGGGGTNSRITFTPTVSGTYRISTTSFGVNVIGAYTLSLSQLQTVTISGSVGTKTGGPIAAPVQVNINCPSTEFSASQITTSNFSFTVPSPPIIPGNNQGGGGTCTITPSPNLPNTPNALTLSWSPSSTTVPLQNTSGLKFTLVGPTVNVFGKITGIQAAPGAIVKINDTTTDTVCNSSSNPDPVNGNYACANIAVVLTNGYKVIATHSTAKFNPVDISFPAATTDVTGQNFSVIPNVSIGNAPSQNEGNSGTTSFNFPVTLSSVSSQPVTVKFSTSNGTATTAGQDYIAVTDGTVIIPANQPSGMATVQVNGDTIDEQNETFVVTLTSAQGANIVNGQNAAIGTINDDDAGGSLQFMMSNPTVNESVGTASVTVTRTLGAASNVTVTCETVAGGTATVGQDYTPVSRTLNFGADVPSQSCEIPIINNSTNEPNETVKLVLKTPTGGAALGSLVNADLTITDDDAAEVPITIQTNPVGRLISVDNATPAVASSQPFNWLPGSTHTVSIPTPQDGAAGTRFVFTGWSDGNTQNPRPITVPSSATTYTANFKTQYQLTTSANPSNGGSVSANPSSAGGWYDAAQVVQLTATQSSGFNFNNWTGSTTTTTNPLNVTMNLPVSQTANFNPAAGSIQFSAADYTADEGVGTTSIEVRRMGGTAGGVTVNYAITNGTAIAGEDYNVAAANGQLTFAANETSKFLTISIVNDQIDEPDKKLNLSLSSPGGGATLGSPASAVLTINDNDGAPSLSINNVSDFEGNSGTKIFTFTVTLSGQSSQTVTVNYATAFDSATAEDFQAVSNQLSFAPGIPSRTIMVSVNGDTAVEQDETFKVTLSGASSGAVISNAQATGTIKNDDVSCQYSLSSPGTAVAGGSSNGSFNVQTATGCPWNAQSNNAWINITSGNPGTGTMPVTFSVDPNNGAARTGTITAAGQTYTVNQAGTIQKRSAADFDGDGKTDLSIFRPGPGEWWYLRSSDGGNRTFQFGNSSDKLVPADYTGDGKTDIAFFRPSTNEWFILRSEDNSFFSFPFGASGDIPVPADFDGDGRADAAVYRSSNQTWFIQRPTGDPRIESFGISGDIPVTADYDGDGKSDLAIYRPSQGQWWLLRSNLGIIVYQFGNSTDKLVQGDYTGDGRADVAFFRPSTNEWFILRSENNSFYSFPFGAANDILSPGDYDGDGKFDAAVFRPSNQMWFAERSTLGTLIESFGIAGDRSVPNSFVP